MPTPDDIQYAVASTRVILPPRRALETFDSTVIRYHYVSERMDVGGEVSIREGTLHAERPQVITPAYFERLLLEGFGEESQGYVDWLQAHIKDVTFLQFGFRFRKEENRQSVVHESLEAVIERVRAEVEGRDDPLGSVLTGVDDFWEICLLKFATDVIRKSAPENIRQMQQKNMFREVEGIPLAVRAEIEEDMRAVGTDRERLNELGRKLRNYGIFENYEDRFFSLVRTMGR
ncbi:MAG: hypothetical protein SFY92_12815 [Verrucomicrobiae bacterium]|nr:hypothetical protein [Verrucomicrobiae bacterium]